MGAPSQGHELAIIAPDGTPLPDGDIGEIAVARHPFMFLGYWSQPERTAEEFTGDWLRTGEPGQRDADGFVTTAS